MTRNVVSRSRWPLSVALLAVRPPLVLDRGESLDGPLALQQITDLVVLKLSITPMWIMSSKLSGSVP
ncbi:hypothetical protein O7602_23665 [Micromonospora sp. WMMD1128]|uniref:hypothetical protein n=1 Tax=Micromonospora sp. WMMD1128 TaxID=3015150 RepID=UPI00248B6DB2|nr:hypothetical protein [Micromonospora sp. WMMD1128]WBB72674.1 hypothetical protein O7602_23665 [Micromonospora sp. WMMD1128]